MGTCVAVVAVVLAALLIGFVFAFFGSIPIAGPIAVAVLAMGLQHRSRGAVFVAIGASIAEAIYAFFAFWGSSAMLARFPVLLPITHMLGCAVLIAFGVYLAVRKPKTKAAAKTKDRAAASGPRNLAVGFSLTIINPTLLVTWTAAISAAHSSGLLQLGARNAPFFAAGVCAGVITWFVGLVAVVAKFRDRVKPQKMNNVVHGMGVALAALGVVLAIRGIVHWHH